MNIDIDPTKTYVVITPDPKFTGQANRVSFYGGRTIIEGVPPGASAAERAEHFERLRWFHNAGYTLEPRPEREEREEREERAQPAQKAGSA